MIERVGQRTLRLGQKPVLLSHAAAVGKKEGDGPLGGRFDFVAGDDRMGEKSWEIAESRLQQAAIDIALEKGCVQKGGLDVILAGDLLNQCISSFLASVHSDVPYLGQYGACSTMAQGLALGACLVEGGAARRLLAAASSHFCSAERQYRFPLAYGGQRTPTAQWTATAAGAAVLGKAGVGPVRVTHALFGRMVEMGVKDANNMGAAMAPDDGNIDPYISGGLCSAQGPSPQALRGKFMACCRAVSREQAPKNRPLQEQRAVSACQKSPSCRSTHTIRFFKI